MQLTSYLIFDGKAEAAFKFYEQCLRGKITTMMRFGEAPGCENMPAETRDMLIHVRLEIGDQVLMASDCPPDRPYDGIKGCSVSIQIHDQAEGERIFNALKDGGTVQMPYEKTFWAERFGMLVDQFGVPWMINCEKGL
ncbi:VOC family protein [Rhodanobacter panaciterrae]|uniref:VOC family protein n=1 Tax=Rhodanobacter panaciterrae TaxID=490572 RepID=A0ABQ2ZTV7_9GAMM|nr:VOC family protein [Rhodanobacter panaciterrae]GGY23250.1 VOC family protein [Rhodanobacter panaciterrae]